MKIEKSMNKILVYRTDDWAALFVNGKMVAQDHDFNVGDLKSYVPIESIVVEWMSHEVDEWLRNYGRFRNDMTYDDIKDLKLEFED